MVIAPDSDLHIVQCPIKLDDSNQLTFAGATWQNLYFMSLQRLYYDHFTYIRKDNVIRVKTDPVNPNIPTFEDLLTYNYCFYKNKSYGDKWFYAFITDISYVNDGMAEITIDTDVFQTWQFDIQYKYSFIEREHVSDDTIGIHTIPEGLETGDYVCNAITNLWSAGKECYVAAMTTVIPSQLSVNTFHTRYGGVFTGGTILVFQDFLSACNFTRGMDLINKPEGITAMFMIPKSLCGTISSWTTCGFTEGSQTINFSCAVPAYTDSETVLNTATIADNQTLNGYTPRNNKMRCYPYNYFYVSNTVGSDVEFHYEDFVNNSPTFKTLGCLTIGGSIRCVPINYKKLADTNTSYNHFNSGIQGAKYPVCGWTNDAFTNWLTEQSVNNNLAVGGGVAAIIAGGAMIATGAGAVTGIGLIAGGIGSIANTMKSIHQHSMIPPQTQGNTNTGDVAFASGSFEFPCYKMSVRYEYAKMIDDFFTMYGYKVNKLATPNIHKRSNWDYIKTINANLEGNIPEKDLIKLRTMFDNGCTFWHTSQYFLDYSQNNSIL
mgnify:CR=1 FL=1